VLVTAGSTTSNIDFPVVPATGGISGTVRDASSGTPLLAVIEVHSRVGDAVVSHGATLTSFATPGTYSVDTLLPGSYYVRVRANGYSDRIFNSASCPGACTAFEASPTEPRLP
jgi:hypothetical protein